jgi:Uma2 family endonuclease
MSLIVITSDVVAPLEVPSGSQTWTGFRRWAASTTFPEQGRIDYVRGRIEIDMAPEDLFAHNQPKVELTATLHQFVKSRDLGWVFGDGARLAHPESKLSVEPDVLFVSKESRALGTVTFRRSRSKTHTGYVEIVGAADLAIEIVSDASVDKDMRILPTAYFAAGVREFWRIDARRDQLSFELFARNHERYKLVKAKPDGFRRSAILAVDVAFTRRTIGAGFAQYELILR